MGGISYDELKRFIYQNVSFHTLGNDFSKRLALISLTCYLVNKFRESKPGITYYQILYKILKDELPQDRIEALSVICENFGEGCEDFPTFGVKPKEMPETIKNIAHDWLPF